VYEDGDGRTKSSPRKIIPTAMEMNEMETELQTNRVILDLVSQDEVQWAQNVGGYMRGLSNPGSMSLALALSIHNKLKMSEAAPILIQLKQWCDKKWVRVAQLKTVSVPSP